MNDESLRAMDEKTKETRTGKNGSGLDAPILEARGITKRFGAVVALDTMDFDLRSGEVHVLFGENGAGKSTLINVIAGAIRPDEGELIVGGETANFSNVHDARQRGIAAMFQEFSLAPHMTVEENVFLGAEPRAGIWLKVGERRRRVADAFRQFGFELDSAETVFQLSRAQQQMVEMTKALLTNPRVLILDEPTASLSHRETEAMFDLVRSLRDEGVGIIYITHRIKEIEEIGDRVTVMRDGKYIETVNVKETSEKQLVELMIGRSFDHFYPQIPHNPGQPLLEIDNLTTHDSGVVDASVSVRAGEIVGIAGLVGCGKSRLARAVFGLERLNSGDIRVDGSEIKSPTPRKLLERGVSYITSDRHKEGLMLARSTKENLTLAALNQPELSRLSWLRLGRETSFARNLGERMHVKPLELDKNASSYSGGNQQKIMIGKSLGRTTRVFLFDEPTVGIDVAARVEVYNFIKELVEAGAAVVIISSDLPEVLHLSHRLYVARDGRLVDIMEQQEIDEPRVLHGFFGTQDAGADQRPGGESRDTA